jgi:hypothetical protein
VNKPVSSSIKNVIIQLTTDYPPLLARVIKFANAINDAYSRMLNGELFIEVIENGILYIFKDWDAFVKIHKPIPKIPELIKKRLFKINPEDEVSILGNELRSPLNYPENGIRYILTSSSNPIEEMFPILEKYYLSTHPDMKVTLIPGQHIIIHFPTYASCRRHFELSYYISQKGLKDLS